MASSFWEEDNYQTEFFCALCGGPFARVYRTNEASERPRAESSRAAEDGDNIEDGSAEVGGANDAPSARVTVPSSWTDPRATAAVPPDVLELDQTEAYLLNPVGQVRPPPTLLHAYPGRLISEEDMRWTGVLRALIHRNARAHPQGGLERLNAQPPPPSPNVYLTGRGRVLEDGAWAMAHPSIEAEMQEADASEEEEEPGEEDDHDVGYHPMTPEERFRFQLYGEPGRIDLKLSVSSIPFHEECWDIFGGAVHLAQVTRGLVLPSDLGTIGVEAVWDYLLQMISRAGAQGLCRLSERSLALGAVQDPIIRLSSGCIGRQGYREAQACVAGAKWRHHEGLHWLVASPGHTTLPYNPFKTIRAASPSARSIPLHFARLDDAVRSPFRAIPPEVLIQVVPYLSYRDYFRWCSVSPKVYRLELPSRQYRRFFREEMAFMPALLAQMKEHEADPRSNRIPWLDVFEDATRVCLRNINLLNRRRIWKIVQPMADEIVERSTQHLQAIGGLSPSTTGLISVTRGNVGVPSGLLGKHQTLVFSELLRDPTDANEANDANDANDPSHPNDPNSPNDPDDPNDPQDGEADGAIPASPASAASDGIRYQLSQIDIWLDPQEGFLRGFQFVFRDQAFLEDSSREVRRMLGRYTTQYNTLILQDESQILTGFRVCWARGFVRGIQFVFEHASKPPTELSTEENYSPQYGSWDGPVRRLVAPRISRTLAGVTAFINDLGLIETLAILEKRNPVSNGEGSLIEPVPYMASLSHQESSLWDSPPPNDVVLHDRLGPDMNGWRVRQSQCYIFAETARSQRPGSLSGIKMFSDGEHLTGLRFFYEDGGGIVIPEDVGYCEGDFEVFYSLSADHPMDLVVVGHGRTGVHCLQALRRQPEGNPSDEDDGVLKYIAAIKFNFTAERIVDWQFRFKLNEAELPGRDQLWKSPQAATLYPLAELDESPLRFELMRANFLHSRDHRRIDGMKGYVVAVSYPKRAGGTEEGMHGTRFCGLRFRRGGLWDEEALGQESCYEHVFYFEPGEWIVSVTVAGGGQFAVRGSVAFTTNHHRTTPWMGEPATGPITKKEAPPGWEMVGLYLGYFSQAQCVTLGLINEPSFGPNLSLSMASSDSDSGGAANVLNGRQDWSLVSLERVPDGAHLSRAVDLDVDGDCDALLDSTVILVDPENLESIESIINDVRGRFGVKCLKFHGNRKMGSIRIGEYFDHELKRNPRQTMSIDGVGGERIIEMAFTFYHHEKGNRIVRFVIKTNRGRQQDVASWREYTDEPPAAESVHDETVPCKADEEFIGFQFIAGTYIHDLTILTRDKAR
ncbi:MAG: hypothetical protein M1826_001883 [Phylliscum demangeonii]|nr:MAG: hypothetical protein M1826_001883 [Phylliscum demangeonii]